MKRYFNTEGQCIPENHYMVRLDQRIKKIKEQYVEQGSYFIINNGRQYGKTTTLWALEDYLADDYLVLSMDFQGITTEEYQDETSFTNAFLKMLIDAIEESKSDLKDTAPLAAFLKKSEAVLLSEMFYELSKMCKLSSKPVVLMIDEVDSASNNQVFIDFLALLRHYYIKRSKKPIFHSVILAGVYDIKNLKLKIRPSQERQYNSPWNIAAAFDIDMSFSAGQIAAMLREYETDKRTGMDTENISENIYQYTAGYPYLVSALCKILDEKLPGYEKFAYDKNVWTNKGVSEAVKILLKSHTPLFDSLVKQLDMFPNLRKMTEDILFQGKQIVFSSAEKSIRLGCMFGFLKESNDQVIVANRIFEMYLLNLFMAEESLESEMFRQGQNDKNQFVTDSKLNMDLVLKKFVEYFNEIYGDNDDKFLEKYGRKFFLLYLKPIINGVGNYYIEAQTRDARRTDVIVDYLGEQFVIALKIWHGSEYKERGEKQLSDYLDYFHKEKGYLLSFNFNKKKEIGVKELKIGEKTIIEAVV